MDILQEGVRGISFLVRLNFDRIFFFAVLCGALGVATWLAHP